MRKAGFWRYALVNELSVEDLTHRAASDERLERKRHKTTWTCVSGHSRND